jgi:hypothetical protein
MTDRSGDERLKLKEGGFRRHTTMLLGVKAVVVDFRMRRCVVSCPIKLCRVNSVFVQLPKGKGTSSRGEYQACHFRLR